MALAGILVLAPLLAPVMILLRCTGEGEVFYRQARVGRGNRPFGIWKFATMLKDSPNLGSGSLTLRGDPRVTPVGRYLRKTKINELPQLLNVLVGDMSFVGPRPQLKVDFDLYPAYVREHIYDVTPGVTGIGSIVFRDEERLLSRPGVDPKRFYAEQIAPYKGELELWYRRRRSLTTDWLLMVLTAWVVLFPASQLPFRVFKDLPPCPEELRTTRAVAETPGAA